jgi:hypothetical protein
MKPLTVFPVLSRFVPDPVFALRLARFLIPASLFAGVVFEPLYHWALRSLGAM